MPVQSGMALFAHAVEVGVEAAVQERVGNEVVVDVAHALGCGDVLGPRARGVVVAGQPLDDVQGQADLRGDAVAVGVDLIGCP